MSGSGEAPGTADLPSETGYDEWVDALADGDGFYLDCANGHGSLPPRRVCPECGSRDLSAAPLPATGDLVTFTEVHVATPAFVDEAPYVTGVAEFGPVRVTGVVRGVDADAVEVGTSVEAGVDDAGTTDHRLVVLRPT